MDEHNEEALVSKQQDVVVADIEGMSLSLICSCRYY